MEVNPPVASQLVLSPEQLTEAIRSAQLEPRQLSAGPTKSRIARVVCPHVGLDLSELGPAMLFTGAMPTDAYTLVYVRRCAPVGRSFNFATDHEGGFIGFFPPGGLLDAYTPEGYANAALTVPEADFLRAVEWSHPEIQGRLLKKGGALRIGNRERFLLEQTIRLVEDTLDAPQGLPNLEFLEQELLDGFLAALSSGVVCRDSSRNARTAGRTKHLRQARYFIETHGRGPLEVGDLCRDLGMSRRGVEVLFRQSLGVTPGWFIRNHRLHGVRKDLLSASPDSGAVKLCALNWGFWHLGHFAGSYHELFGESPRETLRQSGHNGRTTL